MPTLTWSSASTKTWDSENTSTWDSPSVADGINASITSVVSSSTLNMSFPTITVVRNINIISVIANVTAQAKVPRLVLNAAEIIGRIDLIGSRDLYVYLQGRRDLTINLKGGL
jgi:hypothetical protein